MLGAIELLPQIHTGYLSARDQEYVVGLCSEIASTLCSLVLSLDGSAGKALQSLEAGRAAILGLVIDGKSDLTLLRAAHPDCCREYEALLSEVNNSLPNTVDSKSQTENSTVRLNAVKELSLCIAKIRGLHGFESFLQSLTSEEMQNRAIDGDIVVVNISKFSSDAIIVSSKDITYFPLKELDEEVTRWVKQNLTTYTDENEGEKNSAYRIFLSWLWEEIVKPILDHLGCVRQSSLDNLPRLRWIGAGLASSLPFHAASTNYIKKQRDSTFDRVISSYIPSIKALDYGKRRLLAKKPGQIQALIVTMPTTPMQDPLFGATEEAAEISAILEKSAKVVPLVQPTAEVVLQCLGEYDLAHFACHGISSLIPSNSGLVLQKTQSGSSELEMDLLRVNEVAQKRLPKALIAYLSACSTAENKAEELRDEALHVVSGFHVAGFRHVVGCLWPSSDSVCVEVAKSFYSDLTMTDEWLSECDDRDKDRTVAVALHKAVLMVREDREDVPLLWAQYVHFGA